MYWHCIQVLFQVQTAVDWQLLLELQEGPYEVKVMRKAQRTLGVERSAKVVEGCMLQVEEVQYLFITLKQGITNKYVEKG